MRNTRGSNNLRFTQAGRLFNHRSVLLLPCLPISLHVCLHLFALSFGGIHPPLNNGYRSLINSVEFFHKVFSYFLIRLALLNDFRTFDWAEEYKYPTVVLDQM